jgi:hypothetical protein
MGSKHRLQLPEASSGKKVGHLVAKGSDDIVVSASLTISRQFASTGGGTGIVD